MRVTFVLPPVSLSGGIKVVALYAKSLVEMGHKVVVVSPPSAKPSLRSRLRSALNGQGWLSPEQSRESHLDGLDIEHRVIECYRPICDSDVPDADIVIATWWETAEWVNVLGLSKGHKVYFVQGHEIFPNQPQDRVEATYRMPLRKIVVSKWLQDVMRENYGDSDTEVVLNAVDHKQFSAPARGRQDRPTIGFLYSDSAVKAVDVALEVVDEVQATIPDLRVICFGAYRPSNTSILGSAIEFHHSPAQDQIRNIYSQCDVWLSASRSEGFNLTVAEAMACRTPVVATRTGWPKDALISGRGGLLVGIDDVPALSASVRNILALPESDWQEMSRNAFETAATLSWDRSAARFASALQCARQGNRLPDTLFPT